MIMRLLYCQNGFVVGEHLDTQNVLAEDYGPGTRVIPYPDSMPELPPVGPPPDPDTVTPPPYEWVPGADHPPLMPMSTPDPRGRAEPTPTPELLKWFSAQTRFETDTAGITWNDIPIWTDRLSQLLVSNLAQLASSLPPTQIVNFTQEAVAYQFQASQANDLNNEVNNHVQTVRTIESDCITDLNQTTPTITTYEDVEQRFAPARARTLRFGKGLRPPKYRPML
jgi:hypothetical protein